MIPAYNLISTEEVISRIKMDLRLMDTTEHDMYFETLLREGLSSLNCLSQLQKKQCTKKADDGKIELPKDLVKFLALRPKSWVPSTSTPPVTGLPTDCGRFIYADNTFLSSCGCDNFGFVNYNYGFQINKGFIHFNSTLGESVDEATIAYMGMWLDENDQPAIFERFERALTAYVCWKFTRSWSEKYNQYTQESYHMEWVLQRDMHRGMDVRREFEDNKVAISALMRAFIVSPMELIS